MNLTPDQIKLIAKLPLESNSENELRTNAYSGVSHFLEPLAVSLFDFIVEAQGDDEVDPYGQYKTVTYKRHTVPMSLWHEARYLFADLWPDEYMDLID